MSWIRRTDDAGVAGVAAPMTPPTKRARKADAIDSGREVGLGELPENSVVTKWHELWAGYLAGVMGCAMSTRGRVRLSEARSGGGEALDPIQPSSTQPSPT